MTRILLIRRKILAAGFLIALIVVVVFISAATRATPSIIHYPGTFYMAHTEEKVIALTFDDGPDPIDTPEVLDILKENNAHATFFVLGQAAKEYPDLVKRIAEEGNEIGNHSFSHGFSKNQLSEIRRTDETVYAAAGVHTVYYRPPGGLYTKGQLAAIKTNGQIVTLWSIDSRDWLNPGVSKIVRNVMSNAFPGAIILMHDGGYHRVQTVNALEPIISSLKNQGYRFVTLSELKTADTGLNSTDNGLK